MSLKLSSRVYKPQLRTFTGTSSVKPKYDAVIVGGGHNGLVSAAYLAKAGKKVAVFEKRHVLGGAAVTEEIVPGFKFSRASYVLGLLRPQIYHELELEKFGLTAITRNPNSFTPMHEKYWTSKTNRSLTLGSNAQANQDEIAKFSSKDAQNFPKYEAYLRKFIEELQPLLDRPPLDLKNIRGQSLKQKMKEFSHLVRTGSRIGKDFPDLFQLMTSPTTKILENWFESEPLKATLATDSVIGTFMAPSTPGNAYVLLHHLMAEVNGVKEAWGFPIGGMGAVSDAMAASARVKGAELFTDKVVEEILVEDGAVMGVRFDDNSVVQSPVVLSNATSKVTFLDLVPEGVLPEPFLQDIKQINYKSPVCKINVALNCLPNFKAIPNVAKNSCLPHHQATIHLNCESTNIIEEAFVQGSNGRIPDRPMIEMTIPSSVDKSLAKEGNHVALFFTQYVPYTFEDGQTWTEDIKKNYAEKIFDTVEEYAPGFKNSVVGYEVLPPPDLERIFGLTGGNIFHGAMSLDQLYFCRPTASYPSPTTPIKGLYLCGASAHPGGGVMGAPGKIAAQTVLNT